MQNIFKNTSDDSLSPWLMLLIIGGYVFAGLIGFNLIGYLLVAPFFGFDMEATFNAISNPLADPNTKLPLLIVQGITSFGSFVLIPWWIVRKYLKLPFNTFFTPYPLGMQPLLLTILVVFTFMGVNSFFIEWNMTVELPDSWGLLKDQMINMEEQLKLITEYLLDFTSFWHFLVGMIVIAVLPGIGEELLFRGLFQNIFHKIFKNPHVAIWLAAFLFGVFHFQFFGVVPRILLGALFGYLYFFSGHLGYAMLGHFINNGFMLAAVYLGQLGLIDFDPEAIDQSPDGWVVMIFGILTTGLLILFYRYFSNTNDVAKSL